MFALAVVDSEEQVLAGKHRILVVEDAEPVRRMVCAMLMQNGYDVMEAADGTEALQALQADDGFSLVLTDMVMPQMGGTELARQLALLRPNLRIIFMSGYTEDPVVQRFDRSSSIFLPKPFTATALADKVREALTSPWTGMPDLDSAAGS
jgi:CheY-like chemotaxis protein